MYAQIDCANFGSLSYKHEVIERMVCHDIILIKYTTPYLALIITVHISYKCITNVVRLCELGILFAETSDVA